MTEPLRLEQVPVTQVDDLPTDLITMFKELSLNDTNPLTQQLLNKLVPYIVQRDLKVFDHGYNVGRLVYEI